MGGEKEQGRFRHFMRPFTRRLFVPDVGRAAHWKERPVTSDAAKGHNAAIAISYPTPNLQAKNLVPICQIMS